MYKGSTIAKEYEQREGYDEDKRERNYDDGGDEQQCLTQHT